MRRQILIASAVRTAVATMLLAGSATFCSAVADCIPVSTPADLDNIRSNLSGEYCLTNDIDMSGVANFAPIEGFSGKFFGNDHNITNLNIHVYAVSVGLFGTIIDATVQELHLSNVHVYSRGDEPENDLGALAGRVEGSSNISHVSTSGSIGIDDHDTGFDFVGGIVGRLSGTNSTIEDSSSSAVVLGDNGSILYPSSAAGGAVGFLDGGNISRTYVTGSVSCRTYYCIVGGLVGRGYGNINQSYATSSVTGGDNTTAGGLVGEFNERVDQLGGTIQSSFSAATVVGSADNEPSAYIGGLIGDLGSGADVRQTYAVGPVSADPRSRAIGGLIGTGEGTVDSYWDTDTTGQVESSSGTGMGTEQFQSQLPPGFDPSIWGITPGESYPYLLDNTLDLKSPLSTQVLPSADIASRGNQPRREATMPARPIAANLLYVFLPISQRDKAQYNHPQSMYLAGLATNYTMIARAIGITRDVDALKNVKIDTYFWDGKRKAATWQGPVTDFASLSDLVELPGDVQLDDSNVIGALRQRQLVILRGAALNGSTHWLLATLFTTYQKGSQKGRLNKVVVFDPWTGKQTYVNPVTRRGAGVRIDGYVVVTLT